MAARKRATDETPPPPYRIHFDFNQIETDQFIALAEVAEAAQNDDGSNPFGQVAMVRQFRDILIGFVERTDGAPLEPGEAARYVGTLKLGQFMSILTQFSEAAVPPENAPA